MSAWAYPEAISAHMGKFINSQLVYPVGRLLTLADLDAITDRCLEEAARIGAKEHLKKRDRCRNVNFKTYTFMYPVGGLAKEVRVRISVWLQNTNYGGDITPRRWGKSVVAPPSPKPRLCEDDVLVGIKNAYADVDQLRDSFDLDTLEFDDLVKMLVSRKGVWSASDPDFGLNSCLLEGLSGDLGLECVKDAIMQALPSDVTDLDASDALSSLEVISGAVWFKYVKEEGQSIMATVKGVLSDIVGSRDVRCASGVLGSTPYYMEIKRRLGFFYTYKPLGSSQILSGTSAVEKLLEDLIQRFNDGEVLRLCDIAPLARFEFLLPETRKEEIDEFRCAVMEQLDSNKQIVIAELVHAEPLTFVEVDDKVASEEESEEPARFGRRECQPRARRAMWSVAGFHFSHYAMGRFPRRSPTP
jgi:hypothetical protein